LTGRSADSVWACSFTLPRCFCWHVSLFWWKRPTRNCGSFECRNCSWFLSSLERSRSSLHSYSEAFHDLPPRSRVRRQNHHPDGGTGPCAADRRGRATLAGLEHSHFRSAVVPLSGDRGDHRVLQPCQSYIYRCHADAHLESGTASLVAGASRKKNRNPARD